MLYKIFRAFFAVIIKLFGRYQVVGGENFPDSGPIIIVSNHISNWDPMMVGVAMPRQVNFVAKKELFKIPLVGFLLRAWGAVPVKRGRGDREAITKSLELLKEGRVIGIFIEGKRNLENPDKMLKPQSGAAMIALKSGVPVVPVTVINTNRILRSFKRVKVIIGKPMQFPSHALTEGLDKKEQYSQISMELTNAIQELKKSLQ